MLRSNLNNWSDYRFCRCMSECESKRLSIKIMHLPEVLIDIRKCLKWCDNRNITTTQLFVLQIIISKWLYLCPQ